MQNSIIHLIRYAKAQGCTISVHDGEAWSVRRSTNEREIMEAIESVDESTISIRHATRLGTTGNLELMGNAFIINDIGMEPDELVADHTANAFFDAWSEKYKKDSE